MAPKRAMRRAGMISWLGAASVAGMLSGCALPPAVTVASLALDFASYVETGKTVTDHGISFVLDMDCGLLRIFSGSVCTEWPDQAVVVAAGGFDSDTIGPPGDLAYLQVAAIYPAPRDVGTAAAPLGAVEAVALTPAVPIVTVEVVPLVPAVPLGAVETVALAPARDGGIAMLSYLADDAEPIGVAAPWRQLSRAGYLADDISFSTVAAGG